MRTRTGYIVWVPRIAFKAGDRDPDYRYGEVGAGQVDGDHPGNVGRAQSLQDPPQIVCQIVRGEAWNIAERVGLARLLEHIQKCLADLGSGERLVIGR